MKIIASIDTSHEGNDCWINEEWVLIHLFDEQTILHIRKFSGWGDESLKIEYYDPNEEGDDEISSMYKKLRQKSLDHVITN